MATLTAIFFISIIPLRTPHLVLSNGHTGAVLLRRGVGEGGGFSVSYIHSLNISLVTEIYEIREGKIVLTALEEGGTRIEGFDRAMDSVSYMIGYTTEHTLVLGEEQIRLDALDLAGQPVRFDLRRQ